MEALFKNHLVNHCNTEWTVHFRALLQRLKGSLTCAGGLKPDHPIPLNSQPTQSGLQGVSGQSDHRPSAHKPQIPVANTGDNNFIPAVSCNSNTVTVFTRSTSLWICENLRVEKIIRTNLIAKYLAVSCLKK